MPLASSEETRSILLGPGREAPDGTVRVPVLAPPGWASPAGLRAEFRLQRPGPFLRATASLERGAGGVEIAWVMAADVGGAQAAEIRLVVGSPERELARTTVVLRLNPALTPRPVRGPDNGLFGRRRHGSPRFRFQPGVDGS